MTVYLYDGGNLVDAQATGCDGAYLFGGLPAGTYTVSVDGTTPANRLHQEPTRLRRCRQQQPGRALYRHFEQRRQRSLFADFGYLNDGTTTGQAVRTVGGFIWNDLNGDGIYNAGTERSSPA